MKDSIQAGTGNSRYLKSVSDFLTQYPNYSSFAAALVAGTLPIDLNGINAAGFSQVGTPLNKSTLLKDSTATALGLTSDDVPDDAFATIASSLSSISAWETDATTKINALLTDWNQFEYGVYEGQNHYSSAWPNSLTFSFTPQVVVIFTRIDSSIYKYVNAVSWFVNVGGIQLAYQNSVTINSFTTTLEWYSTANAATQLNSYNTYYYWIALGDGVIPS